MRLDIGAAAAQSLQRIDATRLIPGRGEPIDDASLVFSPDTGKIQYAGRKADLPAEYSQLECQMQTVPVLMPGLWDCHVHLHGSEGYSADILYAIPAVLSGVRIARDLVATLNAGYTSVRELSGYGADVAPVTAGADPWIPGPNIYSSVSMLSTTAGHGDARTVPLREYQAAPQSRGFPAAICDGPEACVRAVREQVRRGARVIKVAASGGVADEGEDILNQQFSDAELRAIVDEAARWGLAVAAHCHGKAAIVAATRAGCLTIEHATVLDDEAVDLILERGAIVVPTRSSVEAAARLNEHWTPEQWRKLRLVQQQHARSYRLAVRRGVRIALGSDLLLSTKRAKWTHGMNAVEIQCAVEAGMSPLQAIEAATATAPDTLGPKAPKSGWLRAGYDADFIALDLDPLDDVRVLQRPENIKHVWKAGRRVKTDGQPINFLS